LKEVPLGDRAGGGGNVVPPYILPLRAVQWGGQGLPVRDGTGVTCKKYFPCQICSGDKTTTKNDKKQQLWFADFTPFTSETLLLETRE